MVAVLGTGALTPVGLSARETSASVRAGIVRSRESDRLDPDGAPYITASVPDGPPSTGWQARSISGDVSARHARLLRLAAAAICEAVSIAGARWPAFVGIPEDILEDATFLVELARLTEDRIDPRASHLVRGGREAGCAAIAAAIAAGCPNAVAGGVDSLVDPEAMSPLALEGRIRSDNAPSGFVPGEGAGFLALGADRSGTGSRIDRALAQRSPELSSAIAELCSRDSGPLFSHVSASMNGEARWALPWAVTRARHGARFSSDLFLDHPAECYGDIGAASGPVMAGLATIDSRRGRTLVYASSDDEFHGLIALSTGGR
ncbi:MAG: hypothetical protein H0V44_01450 [Planctomycetes bacterium]|nr:hypothetical protein [Planctomycetota bacterium]